MHLRAPYPVASHILAEPSLGGGFPIPPIIFSANLVQGEFNLFTSTPFKCYKKSDGLLRLEIGVYFHSHPYS